MKTRISSKTSTRLAAVIAVIAVMASFTGCSVNVTSDESEKERETTEATTEATTEETTSEAPASEETTATAADNGELSYPETITSIDDNLFGITIPLYGEDSSDLIEYIVNIREGDIIDAGGEYNTLLPPGEADADVVYIVYNVNLNSVAMEEYADQFVAEGYSIELQEPGLFSCINDDGYRVLAQTQGLRTTVGVYNYAENPNAGVVGIG